MKMGRDPTPDSPEEMRMIHHALENPTRRRMLILMVEGRLGVPDLAREVGPAMLDYHLSWLKAAGLIDLVEGTAVLTKSGEAYGALVKSQADKGGADRV